MPTIKIEIKSCKQCPFFKTGNAWSSDGWDRMEDWICSKNNETIQKSVEWFEEKDILVPEWCPIKSEY